MAFNTQENVVSSNSKVRVLSKMAIFVFYTSTNWYPNLSKKISAAGLGFSGFRFTKGGLPSNTPYCNRHIHQFNTIF